jgi:hypothetical protein
VVINAKDDERLPRASVEALHAALQSPYRIVWMDGSHLRADQSAVIDALRTLILECVVDDDAADGTPERRPAACS